MLQSHIIEIDGVFVGAAIRIDRGYRFVATDFRLEELELDDLADPGRRAAPRASPLSDRQLRRAGRARGAVRRAFRRTEGELNRAIHHPPRQPHLLSRRTVLRAASLAGVIAPLGFVGPRVFASSRPASSLEPAGRSTDLPRLGAGAAHRGGRATQDRHD